MGMLILGLVLFLGVHSVRIFAEDWRTRTRQRLGENAFKGLYSVLSLAGFMLIIWGYGEQRLAPMALWGSPTWTRHLAALIMLPAMVLLVAAYVPGNGLKARLHHPMVLGVKTWALAHLVANNTLGDLLLFGGFLAWAALSYRAARQRDRVSQVVYAPGKLGPTLVTLVVGVVAYLFFVFWAHRAWIGVPPFASVGAG